MRHKRRLAPCVRMRYCGRREIWLTSNYVHYGKVKCGVDGAWLPAVAHKIVVKERFAPFPPTEFTLGRGGGGLQSKRRLAPCTRRQCCDQKELWTPLIICTLEEATVE